MIPIPLPVPAQLWPLFAQAVTSVAQHVGGPALKEKLRAILQQNKLEREVNTAMARAYRNFERSLPDADLLSALIASGQTLQQPHVCQLLAEVAATPLYEEAQVQQLAHEFSKAAPAVAHERWLAAAKLLVSSMQAEMARIHELQPALMMLYNRKLTQAIADQMPLPPFTAGLQASLEAAARRSAVELQHGYVTSAHLLYALTTLSGGVAQRVLAHYGMTETATRQALDEIIAKYDGVVDDPLTRKAEMTFLDAQRLARSRMATATRSEHMLLAILEGRSDSVMALFDRIGIPPARVYDQVLKSIQVESALQSFSRLGEHPPRT
jgi:hypothetical protein